MNTQIYEEATNWLITHRQADLDPQEKSTFDTWLRESPQHVRAYLEMSALWENLPALDPSWNPTPEELVARARSEGNIYPLADSARPSVKEPRSQPLPHDLESPSPRERRGASREAFFQHSVPESIEYPQENSGIPLSALEERGPRSEDPPFRSTPLGQAVRVCAVAATFAIAVVGVTAWYWFSHNTYGTDIGEQRSIVLADGSTVELNSRSRVRIRYSDSQRDVDLLEGQALFRVAHNTARPFIVHSGTANVRAVGTQFDVYKKRTGTVVTVVEGKVAVLSSTPFMPQDSPSTNSSSHVKSGGEASSGTTLLDRPNPPRTASKAVGSSEVASPLSTLGERDGDRGSGRSEVLAGAVFLAAGEQLTVPAVKPSRAGHSYAADSPQRANVSAATAWTRRTLVFESSPLTDVAEEFNRYNTRQLVITDPALANFRISGMFSSVDPALLLKFLQTQPELNVEETETEIRIGKR